MQGPRKGVLKIYENNILDKSGNTSSAKIYPHPILKI